MYTAQNYLKSHDVILFDKMRLKVFNNRAYYFNKNIT